MAWQTWVNNFEIENPIVRAAGISGVVFFDAGNAFGGPFGEDKINPLDLRFAYGAGVRWRSPIGPLRFCSGSITLSSVQGTFEVTNRRSPQAITDPCPDSGSVVRQAMLSPVDTDQEIGGLSPSIVQFP